MRFYGSFYAFAESDRRCADALRERKNNSTVREASGQEKIDSEIAADFFGAAVTQKKFERQVKSAELNKSFTQKIIDKVKEIVAELKEIMQKLRGQRLIYDDARTVMRLSVGLEEYSEKLTPYMADVSLDDKVDVNDARMLIRMAVGLDETGFDMSFNDACLK